MKIPTWVKVSSIPIGCGLGTALTIVVGMFGSVAVCCGGPIGLVVADEQTSTTVPHTVVRNEWIREVQAEKMKIEEDADWCADVPSGATIIKREEKLRDRDVGRSRRRFTTTETYAEWCEYEELKWGSLPTAHKEGTSLDGREWPYVETDGCATEGCRRAGDRTETLVLVLLAEGGTKEETCTVDEATWQSFPAGTKVSVGIGGVVGLPDCESILPR